MARRDRRSEGDGLWALLSVEVHLLLVEVTGWTCRAYEAWLAETSNGSESWPPAEAAEDQQDARQIGRREPRSGRPPPTA